MGKIILILGGARSGKSSYAVELAKGLSEKVSFIATATPSDEEMRKRIRLHKCSRPRDWKVIEAGKDLSKAISRLKEESKVILIDCLGLFVSNLLRAKLKDRYIEKKIEQLIEAISRLRFTTIIVSNEVGGGIVPQNHMARRFRDLVGLTNQMMAKLADEVILMQAGIPIKIKSKFKGEIYEEIRRDNK